jgi:hypothetical protein
MVWTSLTTQPNRPAQPNQENDDNHAEGTAPATPETSPEQALATDELGTFSLSDLMEYEMLPQRRAIEGLIPTGLTILAGRPKFGKSWFAFDACLAVTSGGTLLGKPARQGTTLFAAILALRHTRHKFGATRRESHQEAA